MSIHTVEKNIKDIKQFFKNLKNIGEYNWKIIGEIWKIKMV